MTDFSALGAEADRLLQSTDAFATLSHEARIRLASHAQEKFVLPGELVLREGDAGEEFFLIASGSVHVIGRAFDGSNLILSRLTQGQVFGEQALLPGGSRVRNASIRAAEKSRLLSFARQALLEAHGSNTTLANQLHDIGARQAAERREILRGKFLEEVGLGAEYEIQRFKKDEVIFSEGDPAGYVYLILEGQARVFRGQGDSVTVLAELLPGQFFGERAILNAAPRAATVQATSNLETAALNGAWFRSALARQPKLRSIMTSLQAMYLLPARGLITLQGGTLGTQPALTATYHLPGGRRVISTRMTSRDAFSARVVGAPEATKSARFAAESADILREIHLHEDRIVEIQSDGEWQQCGAVFERLLDGSAIDASELAAFRGAGDFNSFVPPVCDQAEIICRCSRVNAGDLVSMIAGGCNTLEKIAARSKATLVCGGCGPVVNEFLGEGEWTPAVCDATEEYATGIRMFRLRLLHGETRPFHPGQHLVVQGRISGRWVARPYTISSAAGASATGPGGYYEIVIKREEKGLLSRWLFDSLESTSALNISPPRGNYHVAAGNTCDVVFLAGGIGITPALAIARTYASTKRAWCLHIDHSVSEEQQAICYRELSSMAAVNPGFQVNLRVTSRDGRLSAATIQQLNETYPQARYYLCGSPGYVEAVTALIAEAGVGANRIESERFSPVG